MKLLHSALRTFPAATRAVAIGLSLSLTVLIGTHFRFHDPRPKTFLLGDSCIGNYRLEPGQRMQDDLERIEPGMHVENLAEPGATPLDFFLQWSRGSLLAGNPYAAVIAFEPGKFLNEICPHRFDEDGVNLRWLPWNKYGWELFQALSPRERNVAIVQQASLPFYALADVLRSVWIQFVQWPWERSNMRTASVERAKRITAKSIELGRGEETYVVPDERAFAELPHAKEAAFLFRSLRQAGIETRVVLLPFGNPDLIRKTWSRNVVCKHDTILVRMRHWLETMGVAYLDFNAPAELAHFPESVWDDAAHLKDPAAFVYIAQRVHESLVKSPSWPGHAPISVVRSETQTDESTHGD